VALSDREQKLLEQMEQALYAEDPRFATRIRTQGLGRSRRRLLLGVLGVLAGLSLVLLGVLQQLVWLGGLGFALMVAGAAFAFAPTRTGQSGPVGTVAADGSINHGRGAAKASGGKRSGGGFMHRLEERWERRTRDQW